MNIWRAMDDSIRVQWPDLDQTFSHSLFYICTIQERFENEINLMVAYQFDSLWIIIFKNAHPLSPICGNIILVKIYIISKLFDIENT